jgi:two-component system phosphate regulon sensor histidine kinase PhoR
VEWEWILGAAAGVLVLLLAYQLRNLHSLSRWLELADAPEPPRAYGKWDRLHALIQGRLREASRRETELSAALRRWEDAARALPDGVAILAEDRIAWCNGMAQLHLAIDPARDVGTPLTHLVRIPELVAYLEAGDFSRPLQVRAPHDERLLSLRVIPYGDRSLVLSRDVTQFEALERTRREFVANVSHELRTPLTVVSGFLETLQDEHDPEAARRYIDMMSEQSRRMLRLVEDLLMLSALESSPPPPMEDPVPMKPLVERLGAEARALSGGRHRIEVEAEEGVDLVGSEKELASAFGNLVSNAIRYTPEQGLVRLRWKRSDDGAEFSVEDTGIGIPAEHIPRLTERFYRVDRGRSRETGGTGLGLAIVKHALSRHGAQLHVKSQPGVGSTFSARFGGPRLRPVGTGDGVR